MLFDNKIKRCMALAIAHANVLDALEAKGYGESSTWYRVGTRMCLHYWAAIAWRISRMVLVVAVAAVGGLVAARVLA